MYLHPIFGSEDIMRQMPEEGIKFQEVDKTWYSMVAFCRNKPQILKATKYPDMLATLKSLNSTLEAIQKRLNDYLEKKRLFFPRCF